MSIFGKKLLARPFGRTGRTIGRSEALPTVKKKIEIDMAALVGRIGPQAAIVLRSRKAGPMADRRTRRARARGDRKRKAIADG